MTVELQDALNGDGLFDILGRGFFALDTLNTATLTTIPGELEDFVEQFQNLVGTDLDFKASLDGLAAATTTWQSNGIALSSKVAATCMTLINEFVQADSDEPANTFLDNLTFLIEQMQSAGSYVENNSVTLTLATDPDAIGNVGDVAICYTERRGDGRIQENALQEVIQIVVTSESTVGTPALSWQGEDAVSTLSHEWPKGSGLSRQISARTADNSLLSNGNFETTTIAHTPDDWVIQIGTPGSTVWITLPEIQTITIAGTPTQGSYAVQWEDEEGITRTTEELAYNASGSALQTALRAIRGLDQVTVSTTGTSPDYTHTITFTGVAGDLTRLTSVNHLVHPGAVPTITHATVRNGDDGSFKGRSLRLDSDGAEFTTLYQPLDLEDDTVYICHFWVGRRIDDLTSSSSSSPSSSSSLSWSSASSQSSSSPSSSSPSSSSSSSHSSSSWSASTSSSSMISSASESSLSSSSMLSSQSGSSASSLSSSTSSVSWSSLSSQSSSSSSSASTSSTSTSSMSTSSTSTSSGSTSSTTSTSSVSASSASSNSSASSSSSVMHSYSTSSSLVEYSSSSSVVEQSSSSEGISSSSVEEQSSSSPSSSSTSSTTSTSSGQSTSSASSTTSTSSTSASSSTTSTSSVSESSLSSHSSSSRSAEELRVEIVDEIGAPGCTIDPQGYDNGIRIDLGETSMTGHDSHFFSFRLRRTLRQRVFLRIRITAPITNLESVYIDEMAVVKATELYEGGPYVAAFSGTTVAMVDDNWSLSVTNDRAGQFQEWFDRALSMRAKGLLLPSDGTTYSTIPGATLVPDTLIA